MLNQLSQFLRGGDTVKFTLTRASEGDLSVLIQSVLSEAPKDLPPELAQLRAKLATPIVLQGRGDELDAHLAEYLNGIGQARNALCASYEALVSQFQASAAQAKKTKVTSAKTKPAATKEKSAATTAVPAAPPPVVKPPATGADVDLFA